MIARHWHGCAKPEHADDYVAHLKAETFPALRAIPGLVDAAILRRNVGRGVEFLVITRWQTMQAIEQFAGQDAELAVVPAKVQRMMLDYDRSVQHYEVLE